MRSQDFKNVRLPPSLGVKSSTDATQLQNKKLCRTLSTLSKLKSRSLQLEAGGAGGASGTTGAAPGGNAIPSGPTPVGMPSELKGLRVEI